MTGTITSAALISGNSEASPAVSGEDLAAQIAAALARPTMPDGVEIDPAYYAAAPEADPVRGTGFPSRELLRLDHAWRGGETDRPRVPLQLCEFLAYKTALAYESEARIRNFITDHCRDCSRFQFFDSGGGRTLADAQAYGFVLEHKAFVIFRGSESDNDWAINREDGLTDVVMRADDKRHERLKSRYGALLNGIDPSPGRHVGFAIAWASIKRDVEGWLDDVIETGDALSIVFSGHSLGGALAVLAAYDHARQWQPHRISAVVTFGAPMVGGKAFVDSYRDLLGDRTVILESTGDLVPKIMRRWYYRKLSFFKQWVQAGIRPPQNATTFAPVADAWRFSSEPPLTSKDIDNAIQRLKAAMESAEKEREEKARKAEQEKALKDGEKTSPSKPAGDSAAPQPAAKRSGAEVSAPDAASATGSESAASSGGSKPGAMPPTSQTSPPATADGKKPGVDPAMVVFIVVGGFVVLVFALVGWLFVRRKLFSHDIQQRYALYLSTLSYQRLRHAHGGDIERANAALDEHLAFVRGDLTRKPATGGAYYAEVRDLPVRITPRADPLFVQFLTAKDTFV